MKKLAACLWMFVAIGVSGAGETKAPHQTIAPFVDELTFAVIHVDVPRVKTEELWRRFKQITGVNAPAGEKSFLVELPDKFARAGGKDLFLLFNLADGEMQPLVVAPVGAGADKQALLDLFKQAPDGQVAEKAGAILLGTAKSLEAAQSRTAKAVPELAKAFAQVESMTAQVILLPPRPFLRAQEELTPDLPRELGGGPITTVTRGFQWAALGVDITPKLKLKAVAQALDAKAADDLNKLVGHALNGLTIRADRELNPFIQFFPTLKPKVEGDRLVLALDDEAIDKVLTPAVGQVQQAAARNRSANNLKQMALAMHNYHDTFKSLPPPANLDQQKKPLLSWRVHILPFIEQDALYREFKLDEPWDSEHNKKLIARMPPVYNSPLAKNLPAGKTVYLGAAGPDMIFEGPKGMSLLKITDGTSNTIMIVETNDDHAVTWTKPDDYRPDRKNPVEPLVRKDMKGFHTAFADGSVRFMPPTIDADLFWALLTATGGEVIPQP
jgi:Protein of unknown function (DUF1559)